jgi:hypothetical protein
VVERLRAVAERLWAAAERVRATSSAAAMKAASSGGGAGRIRPSARGVGGGDRNDWQMRVWASYGGVCFG